MFEDSVLRPEGGRRKTWIALGSVVAQMAVITALVVAPLIDPARLPALSKTAKLKELTLVRPRVTPPKPVPVRTANAMARSAPAQSAPAAASASHGPVIARTPRFNSEAPVLLNGAAMPGTEFTPGFGSGPARNDAPTVMVKPAPGGNGGGGPLRISTGVMNGRLLTPITPRYPPIAIAAHAEGTVVVTATIDRNGRIVGLQVVSGPMVLRGAAVDAIKDARYQPYLLNGEATEVMTTIAVNFKMSGG